MLHVSAMQYLVPVRSQAHTVARPYQEMETAVSEHVIELFFFETINCVLYDSGYAGLPWKGWSETCHYCGQ